jgi:hypothetical protein
MYKYIFRNLKKVDPGPMNSLFSTYAVLKEDVCDCDVLYYLKRKYKDLKIQVDNGNAEAERIYDLLERLRTRNFLKPLWKDNLGFALFKERHYVGDHGLFDKICNECQRDYFRAEAVRAIVDIVERMHRDAPHKMPITLKRHEFFIVDVSHKWLEQVNLRGLQVHTLPNEVRNPTRFGGESPYSYDVQELKDVLPMRSFKDFYDTKGFYVFVKPLVLVAYTEDAVNAERRFYDNLEKITAAVLSGFVRAGCEMFSMLMELAKNGSERDKPRREVHDFLWAQIKILFKIEP